MLRHQHHLSKKNIVMLSFDCEWSTVAFDELNEMTCKGSCKAMRDL